MSTFWSILIGIGIGLATSVIAWLFIFLALSPRVTIEGETLHTEAGEPHFYQILLSSRRRRRSMIDIKVACDLHIPHHGNEENILALQTSSDYFAFVPPRWARVITTSMNPDTLTRFGQERLNERLVGLNPPKKRSDIVSLGELFDLIPASRIDVTVFASDPISGARNVSRASLRPGSKD